MNNLCIPLFIFIYFAALLFSVCHLFVSILYICFPSLYPLSFTQPLCHFETLPLSFPSVYPLSVCPLPACPGSPLVRRLAGRAGLLGGPTAVAAQSPAMRVYLSPLCHCASVPIFPLFSPLNSQFSLSVFISVHLRFKIICIITNFSLDK